MAEETKMRRGLIYYASVTGNTEKIAVAFKGVFEKYGWQCDMMKISKHTDIKNLPYRGEDYDLVMIGSPVWAFAPTPAMNTFLDKFSGLKGKRVVVLLTSGSGLGVNACFKNIHKILETKGASRIDEINIPDRKNKDGDFVTSSLQKIL